MRQNTIVKIELVCYYKWYKKEWTMRLLRLAIETQKWELAAHTIVLATARILNNGDKPHAGRNKEKKRRPKRQSKR